MFVLLVFEEDVLRLIAGYVPQSGRIFNQGVIKNIGNVV